MTIRNYHERNEWLGTHAERLTITPEEGAIWTEDDTDTIWEYYAGAWHAVGGGGGGGHLIADEGMPLPAEPILNFIGNSVIASDNPGTTSTDVTINLIDHSHSAPGDGGQFDAANLESGASTDGQVLTSDGAGNAAWEDIPPPVPPSLALDDLTDVNAPAPNDNDVLAWDDGAGEWVNVAPGGGSGDSTLTSTYATRPAPSNDGNLFLPSDGFVIERDTGAAYAPWGPIFPLNSPPAVSSLTWINQETATAVETNGGIYMLTPAAAGDHLRLLVKSMTPPWALTVGLLIHYYAIDGITTGLVFRQSSDGKLHTFNYGGAAGQLYSLKFNSPTSFNNIYSNVAIAKFGILFLRIADNNTNRICSWSLDGQNFHVFHTIGGTDFLTANQAGIFINSGNATYPIGITVVHWKET